jgi:hypothetical protein
MKSALAAEGCFLLQATIFPQAVQSGRNRLIAFESLPTTNQRVAQVSILRPGMGKSSPLALNSSRPCGKPHFFIRTVEGRAGDYLANNIF